MTNTATSTSTTHLPSVNEEALRYKIKRGKLIFLSQATGGLVISNSAVPRQNCICTICTCGRHHCPEHWRPNNAETELSEYQQNYVGHPTGHRREGCFKDRQEAYHTTAAPEHFLTTHAWEYVPFGISRNAAPQATTNQPLKRVPFEGNSTHRTEFTPKALGEKVKSAKVVEVTPRPVPLLGQSVSHTDLPNWYAKGKIPRVSRRDERSRVLKPYPFTARTVYRSSYTPFEGTFAATKITPTHDLPGKVPFPYESEYDLNYKEKHTRLCPVYKLPKWKASDVTGHIHYIQDKDTNTTVEQPPSPKKVEVPPPFSPAVAALASQFVSSEKLLPKITSVSVTKA